MRRRAALGLLALALCATSCSGGKNGDAPIQNVLLVTFDTTRADHLGSLGWPKAHTPVLDGLAKAGVLFEQCIAAAPITLPSHASILTGLYPYHHGARNNGTHHVPAEIPTLAETLQRAGFETGAVVSAVVLDSRFGLDQGFTDYDDDLSSAKSSEEFVQISGRAVTPAAPAGPSTRDEAPVPLVALLDPHADSPWRGSGSSSGLRVRRRSLTRTTSSAHPGVPPRPRPARARSCHDRRSRRIQWQVSHLALRPDATATRAA
jgi:hypothetical protein